MSDNSHIEWTDASWNPIRATRHDQDIWYPSGWHCERVSPGCQHCYAETINEKRFGTGLPYTRKSRDLVNIELDEKALTQPLHWRRPRKVFVCSMTDLFGEWVPDEVIDRVFAVMALSPQHTFQLLTKRPQRMREYVVSARPRVEAESGVGNLQPGDLEAHLTWPLANCWLGVSAEDQAAADKRIPELLATPAAVRFISAEPLLGSVDVSLWLYRNNLIDRDGLDWVIVGGESGPGARPCDIGWIRSIVGQCQAAGTACFVKQVGAKPVGKWQPAAGKILTPERLPDRKGGNPDEWPEDLRVREFPAVAR